MEYRIVYRRTIAQDDDQNELRGNTPDTALRFFKEKDLDEWASAVLESRETSDDKTPFKTIGNMLNLRDEFDAHVISGNTIYTFRKIILRSLLERGIAWEIVKNYALKTEVANTGAANEE